MTGVQTCALQISEFAIKNREYTDAKQNNKAYECRGDIGDRSTNLTRLIGAERVSRRDFKYEGTYYVTEDGELYDKEHITNQKNAKNRHKLLRRN